MSMRRAQFAIDSRDQGHERNSDLALCRLRFLSCCALRPLLYTFYLYIFCLFSGAIERAETKQNAGDSEAISQPA
jgi:hypothetical protein